MLEMYFKYNRNTVIHCEQFYDKFPVEATVQNCFLKEQGLIYLLMFIQEIKEADIILILRNAIGTYISVREIAHKTEITKLVDF